MWGCDIWGVRAGDGGSMAWTKIFIVKMFEFGGFSNFLI